MFSNVSIIIPTFNRAGLVQQAVSSALAQSHPNIEVIVVDDGSTDITNECLSHFRTDKRYKYHYQPNSGRSAARNAGAALATGSWLLFLDSDDMLLPSAVADLMSAHARHGRAQLLAGRIETMYGESLPPDLDGPPKLRWRETSGDLFPMLIEGHHLSTGSYIVHRALWDRLGGFDGRLEPCEDRDFALRATLLSEFGATILGKVLLYRRHSSNTPDLQFPPAARVLCEKLIPFIKSCPELGRWARRRAIAHLLEACGDAHYTSRSRLLSRKFYLRSLVQCPLPGRFPRIVRQVLAASLPDYLVSKLRVSATPRKHTGAK